MKTKTFTSARAGGLLASVLLAAELSASQLHAAPSYPIVATGQTKCYDNHNEIAPPQPGQPFYGQDAQFRDVQPSYRNNGDCTVSDLVTGLMWVQARGEKVSWADAEAGAKACRAGGHDDWRMPTIKELYSLIQFTGQCMATTGSKPFLDTSYFGFVYGDTSRDERTIDCQDWSSTKYIGTTGSGILTGAEAVERGFCGLLCKPFLSAALRNALEFAGMIEPRKTTGRKNNFCQPPVFTTA